MGPADLRRRRLAAGQADERLLEAEEQRQDRLAQRLPHLERRGGVADVVGGGAEVDQGSHCRRHPALEDVDEGAQVVARLFLLGVDLFGRDALALDRREGGGHSLPVRYRGVELDELGEQRQLDAHARADPAVLAEVGRQPLEKLAVGQQVAVVKGRDVGERYPSWAWRTSRALRRKCKASRGAARYTGREEPNIRDYDALFAKALEAGRGRDYRTAADLLAEVVSGSDRHPQALLYLGRAYQALGEIPRAAHALEFYLKTVARLDSGPFLSRAGPAWPSGRTPGRPPSWPR